MARLQEHYRNGCPIADGAVQAPARWYLDHEDHSNMGVGEAVADKKAMEAAVEDLTKIAGQNLSSPMRGNLSRHSKSVRVGR